MQPKGSPRTNTVSKPNAPPPPVQKSARASSRAPSRRFAWWAVLVVLGALAVPLGWWWIASRTTPEDSVVTKKLPLDAGKLQEKRLQVVSTQGTVEHRRMGETRWQPIVPGKLIAADESIKTSKNAVAALQVDDKSKIELQKRSVLTVARLEDQNHRFVLDQGKVRLQYQVDGAREVQVQGTDAQAATRITTGDVTIQNNQTTLSVTARKGQATLESQSGKVAVTTGMSSSVSAGEAPALVRPIPNTVMLRVTAPKSRIQRERFTLITGKTSVGAIVRVNDVMATVDREGRFWVRLPLNIGSNRILVQTEDAAGNTSSRELPAIVVDPKAPIDRLKIQWRTSDGER